MARYWPPEYETWEASIRLSARLGTMSPVGTRFTRVPIVFEGRSGIRPCQGWAVTPKMGRARVSSPRRLVIAHARGGGLKKVGRSRQRLECIRFHRRFDFGALAAVGQGWACRGEEKAVLQAHALQTLARLLTSCPEPRIFGLAEPRGEPLIMQPGLLTRDPGDPRRRVLLQPEAELPGHDLQSLSRRHVFEPESQPLVQTPQHRRVEVLAQRPLAPALPSHPLPRFYTTTLTAPRPTIGAVGA